ncbi:MAG: phage major capsid protein [Candidatus Puniceispirillum sp.]|nr:phage major capsid protein [Candidatus Pelagibacter sp.]MBA4283528.1 phage major capsid protein [Candidatus Puniceispirillum sp.]
MHHFKIHAHTLYAKPLISQKLLDDSFMDAEEWLIENIASSMMKAENKSFISGDGMNQPKGFLAHQRIDVGLGEHGFIEEIKTGAMGQLPSIDVFYQAIEAMPTHYLKGAVWYVSRSALTQIRRLKTTDGIPLWQPSLSEGQPQYLCGYPVILSDEMPPLHDGKASSSIALANFKEGYQIVDRQDLTLLRDPYSSKPFVEFYATKRLGGDVIDFNAFKIISCTE